MRFTFHSFLFAAELDNAYVYFYFYVFHDTLNHSDCFKIILTKAIQDQKGSCSASHALIWRKYKTIFFDKKVSVKHGQNSVQSKHQLMFPFYSLKMHFLSCKWPSCNFIPCITCCKYQSFLSIALLLAMHDNGVL